MVDAQDRSSAVVNRFPERRCILLTPGRATHHAPITKAVPDHVPNGRRAIDIPYKDNRTALAGLAAKSNKIQRLRQGGLGLRQIARKTGPGPVRLGLNAAGEILDVSQNPIPAVLLQGHPG